VHLLMSAGTIVLGLVLALYLDASPELQAFGWALAALGVIGLVLRFVLPEPGRRR
jgi:hypothetical protein